MNQEIKWFPLDRIEDLERAISALVQSPTTTRDGIGCHLGLCGLRVREVTNALAKHFEPLNRRLYVCPYHPGLGKCQPLKHGVARTITLSQSTVDAIMAYRDSLAIKSSKWLLPNRSGDLLKPQLLSKRGRSLLLSLGMMDDPSTRFHTLRHTCAMRILAQTDDILMVKRHLGHRNVQTTMTYVDCLKEVPPSCLARIYDETQAPIPGAQMQLFNPFDASKSATG